MGLTLAEEIKEKIEIKETTIKYSLYSIQEPIVANACFKFLSEYGNNSLLKKASKQLIDYLEKNMFRDSAHGKIFERCIFASICDMSNNTKISELPFLSKDSFPNLTFTLPKWMDDIKINLQSYGSASELGYNNDNEAIIDMIKKKFFLLMPLNAFGPDGIHVIKHNGELYIITISSKLFSNCVPWSEHLKSFKTTDIDWCYSEQKKLEIKEKKEKKTKIKEKSFNSITQKDIEYNFNIKYKGEYDDMNKLIPILFEKTAENQKFLDQLKLEGNIGGILRIHVEYPYYTNYESDKIEIIMKFLSGFQ
jgi:hypothetical protein